VSLSNCLIWGLVVLSLLNNIKSFIYIPYFEAFIYKGGNFCGKYFKNMFIHKVIRV